MVKRQRKNLEDDDPLIDPSAREYIYDEVDEYNELGKENDDDDLGLSDSENEFDGDTRLISKDKRKEQILGLDLDSSDEDEDDIAGFSDDIENSENEQNDMVENRSLGRRKKDYYGTDITDQRLFNIGRHKTKKKGEEDSLQIEMDGAIAFQKRNLTGKFGFDFDLEPEITAAGESKGESMEDQLKGKDGEIESKGKKSKSTHKLKKIMHSKFSDIDKLAKEVCEELQSKLVPLIEASKNGVLPESFDTDYLLTRYFLCLNFMTTFAAEKMLIAGETDMEGHSVEKRLSQYRELFKTMETCKRKYESELDPVLDDLKNGKLKKKRKLLGVVKLKKKDKIVTFEKNKETMRNGDKEEMYSEDGDVSEVEEKVKESRGGLESVEGKRLITHEIKKNKGLMPTRKKEQRNPRVKYKRKYQDKLKRRKGQIREVRKEIKRYGGEISGINKNVVKSIKLK